MKVLKYNLCMRVNFGTEAAPRWEELLMPVTLGWNQINEETARREAHQGVYTIEENDEEVWVEPTPEERITDLEEALELLLAEVTE